MFHLVRFPIRVLVECDVTVPTFIRADVEMNGVDMPSQIPDITYDNLLTILTPKLSGVAGITTRAYLKGI